ncbi:MAG: cytosine permease, partial [Brachybacterium sp.]
MTSSENRPATAPIGGLGVIETAGIEIIAESERTAKPRDLIWPWFAANVSVFGMSYGSYLLGFGISFLQATIVAVIGIVISFLLCGLVAIAGKRGSVP